MSKRLPSVSETRAMIVAELVDHARRNKAFRSRLVRDPRATVEHTLGLTLPASVQIHVHEETPTALHLVLPLDAEELTDEVVARTELGDREVAGFEDKNPNPEGESGPKLLPTAGRRG